MNGFLNVLCCCVISDMLPMLQIHLFDIDIPGEITFIESKTLTAGETPTIVDTGLICYSSHGLTHSLFQFCCDFIFWHYVWCHVREVHI